MPKRSPADAIFNVGRVRRRVVALFRQPIFPLFLLSYTALFTGALIAPDLKSLEDEVAGLERELELDEQALKGLQRRIEVLIEARKRG